MTDCRCNAPLDDLRKVLENIDAEPIDDTAENEED